jgi:hypothetical protein
MVVDLVEMLEHFAASVMVFERDDSLADEMG